MLGGGAGGNVAGKLLKNIDLSKLTQTVVGIIGGVASGQAVDWLGVLAKRSGRRRRWRPPRRRRSVGYRWSNLGSHRRVHQEIYERLRHGWLKI